MNSRNVCVCVWMMVKSDGYVNNILFCGRVKCNIFYFLYLFCCHRCYDCWDSVNDSTMAMNVMQWKKSERARVLKKKKLMNYKYINMIEIRIKLSESGPTNAVIRKRFHRNRMKCRKKIVDWWSFSHEMYKSRRHLPYRIHT